MFKFLRSTQGLAWLSIFGLLSSLGAQAPVSLAISPVYNFSRDSAFDEEAYRLRNHLIGELVVNYDCLVLSRNDGLSLSFENALSNIKLIERQQRLVPAKWVITPVILKEADGKILLKCVILNLNEEENSDGQFKEKHFPYPDTAEKYTNLVKWLSEKLALPQRSSVTGSELAPSKSIAVMPITGSRAPNDFPVEHLLAAQAQAAGLQTVSRSDIKVILKELSLAQLNGATELAVSRVGSLIGADYMLQPSIIDTDESGFSLQVLVVDSQTGVIVGGVKTTITPDRDVSEIGALLPSNIFSVPVFKDHSAEEGELLVREAKHYLNNVSEVSDNATESLNSVTQYGLEQAEAAYLLTRTDHPELLYQLLLAVDDELMVVPDKIDRAYESFDSTFLVDRAPPSASYRGGVRDLVFEILDQIEFNTTTRGSIATAYFRAKAELFSGNLEAAEVWLSRDWREENSEKSFYQAMLEILRANYQGAEQILLRSGKWQELLAKCYFYNGEPEKEIRALQNTRTAYMLSSGVANRLMILMLEHLPPQERVKDINEKWRSRWLKPTAEYKYYVARTWKEAGDLKKAWAAVKEVEANTRQGDINPLTQSKWKHDLDELREGLQITSTYKPKSAAQIHPLPDSLKIYLQPMGDVKSDYCVKIAKYVGGFFGGEAIVRPSIPLPTYADFFHETRNQYDADKICDLLHKVYPIPEDTFYLVFITREDIFAGNLRWIFAHRDRGLGAFYSDHRLRKWLKQNYPAKPVAYAIVSTQNLMFRYILSNRELLDLTGSERWPNSPDSITYSNGNLSGPFKANGLKGMHYCEDIAKIYEAVTPQRIHEALMKENKAHRAKHPPSTWTKQERDYAELIQEALEVD